MAEPTCEKCEGHNFSYRGLGNSPFGDYLLSGLPVV